MDAFFTGLPLIGHNSLETTISKMLQAIKHVWLHLMPDRLNTKHEVICNLKFQYAMILGYL